MFRRVLKIVLVIGVGFATMYAARAEAVSCTYKNGQRYCFIGGRWRPASPTVTGCYWIGHVPNPDQNPAELQCSVEMTVRPLCINPKKHEIWEPGKAAILEADFDVPIDVGDWDKDTGIAEVCLPTLEGDCAIAPPGSLLCDPAKVCRNRNWHTICALPVEILATCSTHKCLSEDDPITPENEACDITGPAENTLVCSCTTDGTCDDPPTEDYDCVVLDPETMEVVLDENDEPLSCSPPAKILN